MNALNDFIDTAGAIVGPANIHVDRADLAAYEIDGRGQSGKAQAVVRPSSTDQVAAVVHAAQACGVALVPQGARTGLVAAGLADASRTSCILSLERLRQPPRIDPVNRSARVDAGVRLSDLNAAAGAFDLTFPIDLGADPSIGGMVTANTGGARFLRYGDVRRSVLGLQVVLNDPDGTILELGGETWKDNSGLDLKHLFIGASGSLGIVTRATLALQPKAPVAVTAMLAVATADGVPALLGRLEAHFGTLLTAFEGMSGTALDAALNHVPHLRAPFAARTPTYAVLIELSAGAAIAAEALVDALGTVLADELASGAVTDVAVDHGGGLWAIRHAIPEGLRAAGHVVACDIALRRGDTMRFRRDVLERLACAQLPFVLHDFGHIGDGGLHFNLVWPAAQGALDPALADQARDIVLDAAVNDYGGSFSAEHGIGPSNIGHYRCFVAPDVRRLAGAIQRVTAPTPIGRVDFAGPDPRPQP